MSKEQYNQNRRRVFEIMEIAPENRNYNCHHIVFKSDNLLPEDRLNDKSNLFPLSKADHERLHRLIEGREGGLPKPTRGRKRKEKHRLGDLKRIWG